MLRRFKKSCIGFESHETREKSPCDLFDKQCKNNVALQYFIRRVGDTPLIFLLVFPSILFLLNLSLESEFYKFIWASILHEREQIYFF